MRKLSLKDLIPREEKQIVKTNSSYENFHCCIFWIKRLYKYEFSPIKGIIRVKIFFFFQFYHRNFCKLISICKRHSQGYCGQPLTKILDSKLSKMAGVLLLWESWWGGGNTYPWILKSSSAFFAKWPRERNDLVCLLVWKWMMDIGRITSFEAMVMA